LCKVKIIIIGTVKTKTMLPRPSFLDGLGTDQVKEYYICSVYMGNACIRAYGDSLNKVF
jgi:hypothetical protein